MALLEEFTSDLQYYLCKNRRENCNIVRKHSKKLDKLGDVSFPLNCSNWCQLLDKKSISNKTTIFDYHDAGNDLESQLEKLRKKFNGDSLMNIRKTEIIDNNVNLFLSRNSLLFQTILQDVCDVRSTFGCCDILRQNVFITTAPDLTGVMVENVDLSNLRLVILRNISQNIVQCTTTKKPSSDVDVILTLNSATKTTTNGTRILCGPILNEKGQKTEVKASQLYCRRTSDMRMMAQHKYGVQIKPDLWWKTYFEELGKASISIEMLSNKPSKPIKITLNDLQSSNRGSSFIFYNCARLNALIKEFDKRVLRKIYPILPAIDNVEFSQLVQPEEWELFYVYIMQYPLVIKSCIQDIEKGILSPQQLITFLANLSSLFSSYYRRIKILVDPRQHLFSILHARIFLLKGIQYIIHHALSLMDIKPIKEM